MVKPESGFIAIVAAALCCHGYELDLNRRKKREDREKKAEEKKAAKEAEKLHQEELKEAQWHRDHHTDLVRVKRRTVVEDDCEPLTLEETKKRRRYNVYYDQN